MSPLPGSVLVVLAFGVAQSVALAVWFFSRLRRLRAIASRPMPTPEDLAARRLFNAKADEAVRYVQAALKWGCTLGEAQLRLTAGVCPHCGRGG